LDWIEALNGQGFSHWLTRIAGQRRIPERKLDPFATSARRLGQWYEVLVSARATPLQGQSRVDLRAAGMVDDGGHLTELADRVLRRWDELGLQTQPRHAMDQPLDVARALVLVREAVGTEPYDGFVEFWREIRRALNVDQLLAHPELLMLVGYLDQTLEGFNPWQLIRTQHDLFAVDPDWTFLGPALEDRTDVGRRGNNRVAFCQALELSMLTAPEARAAAVRWELPSASVAALQPMLAEAPSTANSEQLEELLLARHNVIFYGPPGTGKTRAALAVADRWRYKHGPSSVFPVTFHPSYSYEDFVQGFRPDPDNPDGFKLQDGLLLEAASAAERGPVLLLIDEINRGDTARIFGELITYVEPEKRRSPFRLAQSPRTLRTLPRELYIVGTMNTADRSVSLMDTAMRRRFAFVGFPPDPSVYESYDGWLTEVAGVSLSSLLRSLNSRLRTIGVETDRAIGHSLLAIPASTSDAPRALHQRFQLDIYPLVLEYCSLDRGQVRSVLGNLVSESGDFLEYNPDSFKAGLETLV